jgi:hypothetical protein
MPLIDRVWDVCRRMDGLGWRDYLLRVSDLDIRQAGTAALAEELARPLTRIQRTAPGFRDFAAEGVRGIEPGNPSHSLLFHALASPQVGSGQVTGFPTSDDIEWVENYVYGVNPPSIIELRLRAGGAPLAVAVYAVEYRPAIQTVHQNHADMCYARTGIARIGTLSPLYVPSARGYSSLGTNPSDLHAIPCRYSAYVAAQFVGDAASFGPMLFRKGGMDAEGNPVTPDSTRRFWVPLHKLFSGEECIRDRCIDLRYFTDHSNEKLRRIHLWMEKGDYPVGFSGKLLKQPPFVLPESELVDVIATQGGSLRVEPLAKPLVQEVSIDYHSLAFSVVPGGATNSASFRIPSRPSGARSAPEYVYVRQEAAEESAPARNLNQSHNVVKEVNTGDYKAQHYVDHTGDGWIRAECGDLAYDVSQYLAAYSLIAAPDLYPAVREAEVLNWWTRSVSPAIKDTLFPDFEGSLPMEPLCDARITANMTYRNVSSVAVSTPVFVSNDDSYTAVVSLPGAGADAQTRVDPVDDGRAGTLPDCASGLFAPGWDVSMDLNDDENSIYSVLHLSAYGGGSPFIEDVRLCSAESGFWPALSPDTSRLYVPQAGPTVTPVPQSRLGWDGLEAPELIAPGQARFHSLAYSDYVQQALGAGFDFQKIGATTIAEYKTWTLLMALVYQAINATDTVTKMKWSLLYFDQAAEDDADLEKAQKDTGIALLDPYSFYLIYPDSAEPEKDDPSKVVATFQRSVLAFATPHRVLYLDTLNPGWQARVF